MPALQVVLLSSVPTLGTIGDVRHVAAGYARNFLFPRGLAVHATPKRLADSQFQRQLQSRRVAAQRAEDERLAQGVQGATLVIHVAVGAQGRMHGQITNQDVADAIQQQVGVAIDRHKIQIDSPIRSLGRYLLPIKFAAGIEASVTLEVAEHAEEPAAPETPAPQPAET